MDAKDGLERRHDDDGDQHPKQRSSGVMNTLEARKETQGIKEEKSGQKDLKTRRPESIKVLKDVHQSFLVGHWSSLVGSPELEVDPSPRQKKQGASSHYSK